MIRQLIETGSIADIVLIVMFFEAAIIVTILVRQGRRQFLLPYVAGILAGAALVLALRASLSGDPWFMIALFLSFAFAAHIMELALRWRGH